MSTEYKALKDLVKLSAEGKASVILRNFFIYQNISSHTIYPYTSPSGIRMLLYMSFACALLGFQFVASHRPAPASFGPKPEQCVCAGT